KTNEKSWRKRPKRQGLTRDREDKAEQSGVERDDRGRRLLHELGQRKVLTSKCLSRGPNRSVETFIEFVFGVPVALRCLRVLFSCRLVEGNLSLIADLGEVFLLSVGWVIGPIARRSHLFGARIVLRDALPASLRSARAEPWIPLLSTTPRLVCN